MAKQVQTARQSDQSAGAELTLAELMDPVALEARLAAARARRAEALARRRDGTADPASLAVTRVPRPKEPDASPAPIVIPPVAAAPQAAAPARSFAPPARLPPQPRMPALPVLAAETPVVPRPAPKPVQKPAAAASRVAIGTAPALMLAILIGLIGGGAAVLLAPPSLRQHIADRIAPARSDAPAARDSLPTVESRAPAAPTADRAAAEPAPPSAEGPWLATVPSTAPTAPIRVEAESLPRGAANLPAPPTPDTIAATFAPTLLAARAPALQPDLAPALPRFAPNALVPSAPEAGQPEAAPAAAPRLPVAAVRPAPAPRAVPAPPVAGLDAVTKVYVHYPPSAAATATVAVDALRAAGVGEARAIPSFSVPSTNVRFYHPEDRAAAESVSRMIGAAQGGPVPEARDFTDFRPLPPSGVLEIWLGGTTATEPAAAPVAPADSARPADSAPRVARRDPARSGTGRAAPGPTPAERAAQQARTDAVQQIVVRRAVERMLRQQLGN